MRMPRVRFREFLLLIVMASLITAAYAIRARTASLKSSYGHSAMAYRERSSASWWKSQVELAKRRLEDTPGISPDRVAELDVRLLDSVSDWREIPTTGTGLVVVADVHDTLHFRVFDGKGCTLVDLVRAGESRVKLLDRLADLWPPHELTPIERGQVIDTVASCVDVDRAMLRAHLRSCQSMHAEAVARAEIHERLAQGP